MPCINPISTQTPHVKKIYEQNVFQHIELHLNKHST